MSLRKSTLMFLAVAGLLVAGVASSAAACGGLFCQNTPVNQIGERIVFTINDADASGAETITSLIEIQYNGEAEDFSWILPIPEAIGAGDLEVPEDGDEVFDDLHTATDVRIIAPTNRSCGGGRRFSNVSASIAGDAEAGGVEVFASGEVGPFGFDVIGSSDPNALIDWLKDNNYRVEPEMEPLMNVYVEEEFAFVAMRLLDGETSDSIAPIEITYPGTKPMIPIRLTAVAANPEMPVFVWFFADTQVVPENYEHFEIATEEITFFDFGGNNYESLIMMRADALGGRAFITEFAGPTDTVDLLNPYLRQQAKDNPYLTRLKTFISPREMTVDPVFTLDAGREDVSNVRDASDMNGLYDCQREQSTASRLVSFGRSDAINPFVEGRTVVAAETPSRSPLDGWGLGFPALLAVGGAGTFWYRRRRDSKMSPDIVS